MLPSRSGILAEAISIAFTSLQQRQSISLASFLHCPHFHQSRFPILICNKTAAEAHVQFQEWPPQVFCEKSVLKNFSNFTGKHLCWSLFLTKLQVFRSATLLKGDANTSIFLENLRIFFKNAFFEEQLRTTASVVSFSWHLCWSPFLINLQAFRSATLLKRDLSTGVFL